MIFEDATHRRWRVTVAVFVGCVFMVGTLLGLYVVGLARPVALPAPSIDRRMAEQSFSTLPDRLISPTTSVPQVLSHAQPSTGSSALLLKRISSVAPSPYPLQGLRQHGESQMLRMAYLVQSDTDSVTSFERRADAIDIVVPDWYFVTHSSCAFEQNIDEHVRSLFHQRKAWVMPRVANVKNGTWLGSTVSNILQSPSKRSCLANALANAVGQTDAKGLNIDFEEVSVGDREAFVEFMAELAHRLHTQHQLLTVDIPVRDDAFDLYALSKVADGLILMAYDEHQVTSPPGPIASQAWVDAALIRFLQTVPVEKALLATGGYGYQWTETNGHGQAYSLKYHEVMRLARQASAQPRMDPVSLNMRFTFQDERKNTHRVWFLDQHTFWNQQQLAQQRGVGGMALWRLGSEDERLWNIWQSTSSSTPPLSVTEELPALSVSVSQTKGEIFRVSAGARPGRVERRVSPQGIINSVTYVSPPSPYVLDVVQPRDASKQIVLTFDDGPDTEWTPKILELLDRHHVPATFFVVGNEAQRHPELIREIVARGHLVGNHTYTHADIRSLSPSDVKIELNRTQMVLASLIGKKTVLFRPPYHPDASPEHPEDLKPLPLVTRLGYIIVGAHIDPRDWEATSTGQMVAFIEQQAAVRGNNIIMFHDGGGNRVATVAALDQTITRLKGQGYQFVGIDSLMQVPTSALNLPLTRQERLASLGSGFAEQMRHWQWRLIYFLFLFTNLLSVFRIVFLAIFAVRSKHERTPVPKALKQAPVTVIIPAYNEEKTIEKTIRSLQKSTHTNFEALVVNDGSTDRTPEVVRAIQRKDPRIHLVDKENGGKFSALNLGFKQAHHEMVVTIDADTILYPQTINELIKPFDDPAVDAVCGNVEVGNVHNLLTGFQALEYITTQNFDRRAFEKLNCISVVPGATGAWRRQRVLEIGGYEADTLVEDADVTLRLLQRGGKIVYAPEARSRTEAPETVHALAKQRLRWSFGTYQCLRKHARYFFHGTLGWVALPNIFFFQILYPVLSPIGDLVFLWSLFHGRVYPIIFGYIFFVLVDLVGSALAFSLEKRSPRLILLILIQRFFYRQFMYVIAFRSVIAVLHGTRQDWNKLKRQGSVSYA